MKAHIKRWVCDNCRKYERGFRIPQLPQRLQSSCRYKLIPLSRLAWKIKSLHGISFLNNSLYEERGVRAWKAYKVGPGCFFPYDKVIIERQGDTGLKVIQPFGARTKERGTIAENTRPLTEIFPCTETGCVLSFKTLDEVEQHMDSGKQVRELESESLYDSIRKKVDQEAYRR